jgi:hypothetical protein
MALRQRPTAASQKPEAQPPVQLRATGQRPGQSPRFVPERTPVPDFQHLTTSLRCSPFRCCAIGMLLGAMVALPLICGATAWTYASPESLLLQLSEMRLITDAQYCNGIAGENTRQVCLDFVDCYHHTPVDPNHEGKLQHFISSRPLC